MTSLAKARFSLVLLSTVFLTAVAFGTTVPVYLYDGVGPGALPDALAPDNGNTALTDGILPASAASTDPAWVGFHDASLDSDADHPQVTFTYAATQAFDHIDIVYLHATNPPDDAITAPDHVFVAFSEDGSYFKRPMQFSSEFDDAAGGGVRTARDRPAPAWCPWSKGASKPSAVPSATR